jgi:RNA polymerase sigma-70 factor (ECF subfamily)
MARLAEQAAERLDSAERSDANPDPDELSTPSPDDPAQEFLDHRPRLLGIAYRMLGSTWDAEDVVADVMVRWLTLDRSKVREPAAFLTTMVTRRAIDQLRSARVARESYVGPWLPEPVLTSPTPFEPLDRIESRETLSIAALRMMEQLSPPERAVLVLHEVYDVPHAEIADTLGITTDAARQHLRRARTRLDDGALRFARDEEGDRMLQRFLEAIERDDIAELQQILADDVVAYSDGGNKARAARHPIVGWRRVATFFAHLGRRLAITDVRSIEVNGRPAVLMHFGRQELVLSLHVRDGKIREIHSVINPDKLVYLRGQLAGRSLASGE